MTYILLQNSWRIGQWKNFENQSICQSYEWMYGGTVFWDTVEAAAPKGRHFILHSCFVVLQLNFSIGYDIFMKDLQLCTSSVLHPLDQICGEISFFLSV